MTVDGVAKILSGLKAMMGRPARTPDITLTQSLQKEKKAPEPSKRQPHPHIDPACALFCTTTKDDPYGFTTRSLL